MIAVSQNLTFPNFVHFAVLSILLFIEPFCETTVPDRFLAKKKFFMKKIELTRMEVIEAGGWTDALGCAAGIGLVALAITETPTGIGTVAGLMHFVVGVEAIYDYCGNIY